MASLSNGPVDGGPEPLMSIVHKVEYVGAPRVGDAPVFLGNDRFEVDVANAGLGELGLEVTQSRIMTEKGAAIDTIYIKTPAGTKVTDAELLTQLQNALNEVIALPEIANA